MVYRLVTRATVEERMLQVIFNTISNDLQHKALMFARPSPPPCPLTTTCLFPKQRAKSKLVLEHLVVAKAGKRDGLAQTELDDLLRYGAKELFDDDELQEQAAQGQPQGATQQQGSNDNQAVSDAEPAAAAAAAAGEGGSGAAAVTAAATSAATLRIVWDDAALDRLLDRSALQARLEAGGSNDAGSGDESDDEFTKAFKACAACLCVCTCVLWSGGQGVVVRGGRPVSSLVVMGCMRACAAD